jgi:hypothetical protein
MQHPHPNRTSRIAGFHKMTPRERLDRVAAFADLAATTEDSSVAIGISTSSPSILMLVAMPSGMVIVP